MKKKIRDTISCMNIGQKNLSWWDSNPHVCKSSKSLSQRITTAPRLRYYTLNKQFLYGSFHKHGKTKKSENKKNFKRISRNDCLLYSLNLHIMLKPNVSCATIRFGIFSRINGCQDTYEKVLQSRDFSSILASFLH